VKRPLLVIGLSSTVACAPYLDAITPPPPQRAIELDAQHDRIELSEATAIAFECRREGSPCRNVSASVGGSEVAAVYATHLSQIQRYWGSDTNVSALTLVGLKPGTTKLRVSSDGWTHDYAVTVIGAR
jgi:hypothetical protein